MVTRPALARRGKYSVVVTPAEGMEPETLYTVRQRVFALVQQEGQPPAEAESKQL
jgi:hypothetical protein